MLTHPRLAPPGPSPAVAQAGLVPVFGRDGVVAEEAAKVVVRKGGELIRGKMGEGLTSRPGHGLDGDERQEAVLTRQGKLRVDPLDLDHAAHVGIEVEVSVRVDLSPTKDLATAAWKACIVERETAVVVSALPVLQVDLETENSLDSPDREFEVRPKAGSGVPLAITGPRQVAVIEVRAHRGDLIEETGDRHRGLRGLSQRR